jgi:pyridoxine kinase
LDGAQLLELIEGLEQNGFLSQYTHILTGYIGSETFLRAVEQVLGKLRAANPAIAYLCDPVMGDTGPGLYVPSELPAIYREWVREATICTPNQFEAEVLTGVKILTFEDAAAACDVLHAKGVKTVFLTTLQVEESYIHMMCSEAKSDAAMEARRYVLAVPRVAGSFTGTGDLCAAMVLAWMERHPFELALVLEKVASVLQAVIIRATEGVAVEDRGPIPPELRLVECVDEIRDPQIFARATAYPCRPAKGILFEIRGALLTVDGSCSRDFAGSGLLHVTAAYAEAYLFPPVCSQTVAAEQTSRYAKRSKLG